MQIFRIVAPKDPRDHAAICALIAAVASSSAQHHTGQLHVCTAPANRTVMCSVTCVYLCAWIRRGRRYTLPELPGLPGAFTYIRGLLYPHLKIHLCSILVVSRRHTHVFLTYPKTAQKILSRPTLPHENEERILRTERTERYMESELTN